MVKWELLYGSERRKEVKTFLNRCLRCIRNTHWPEVISNEQVWRKTEEIELSMEIKRRKWNWVRHTLRKGNEAMEREALDWNPQGKRRRKRPRHTWRRTVKNEALVKGMSWNEVKKDGRK